MNSISKIGLAAVFALGVSGVAIAQDAGADAGAGADLQVQQDDQNAMDMGVDVTTTGSIQSQDSLATSIQGASSFDLSAFSATTPVNCVTTSSLDAGSNAQAIGEAATDNTAVGTLRTDIQANADLMSKLQSSCDVASFDVNDIVFVETGADGALTFYYDDSAA